MNLRLSIGLAAAVLLAPPVTAAPVRSDHIEAELVAEQTAWLPGATNWVALRLKPEAGWHTYWRNPGDSGLPTTLKWSLPQGWSAGEIQWPYPQPHKLGDLTNYGYSEETLHLVALQLPARSRNEVSGGVVSVQALAKWLVCADICIPGQAELSLGLPLAEIATADPVWSPRFEDARRRLPRAEPLPGSYAIGNGELNLRVQAGEQLLAGAQRSEFFAYANNLVNHGAAQRSLIERDGLRFSQPLSSFFSAAPEMVEGVLVVHGADTQAYTAALGAGGVAALPQEAAPPAPVAAPQLALILLFALLGGLILNLMPCVFPVLAIKAVSVIESHRDERAHALAYASGVILSCAAVAGLLIALRASGQALGWGFQLQSPVFIALLAYLMFALGLSLSGVAQFGTSFMGVGQSLTEQGGYAGSFFTGVLATVVASPCTAPFMGVALGYAIAQPAPVALLVFMVLGLGLALPFLLLGFFPRLGAWLPRPGAWMETFKQVMAFPLYLTAVWLLWVLGRQSGANAITLALAGLVLIGFALWLWSKTPRGFLRTALAMVSVAGALALLAHPALKVQGAPAALEHEAYSDARLAQLRAEGRTVFVNFTADWCITCKANEKVTLDSAAVKAAFAAKNVAWLTADWTREDPAITAALARFGRNGVPLYLLYPSRGEAEVLPQLLTPDIVIEALEQLEK
jgi:thiol:disulfide interchange protein DsbD